MTETASGAALEIGAGHGILSRPLIKLHRYAVSVITDSSPTFLEHISTTLKGRRNQQATRFATLSSLAHVPLNTFEFIVLRYVLHHIPNWKAFIRDAARVLVSGGALLMVEPISDGFMLQRALASACIARAESESSWRSWGTFLGRDSNILADFKRFVSQLDAYLLTDIDKSRMEDKHQFAQHQLVRACSEAGMSIRILPNDNMNPVATAGMSFSQEFRHNAVVNFQFPPATVAAFHKCFQWLKVTDYDRFDRFNGTGPVVQAVIIARKP